MRMPTSTSHPLAPLYEKLAGLLDKEQKSESVQEIPTPRIELDQLQKLIKEVLGEHLHLMMPDPKSSPSPWVSDARKAIPYVKKIKDYQGQLPEEKTLLGSEPLKKPLVMIFPLPPGQQYVTCVILPKNYQAPFGEPTKNTEGEVAFYMDPSMALPAVMMPAAFLPFFQLINSGCSYTDTNRKPAAKITIPPIFPKLRFINGSRQLQYDPADGLLCSVYNALMIVLTGHTQFAERFPKPDQTSAYRLRGVFNSLIVPAEVSKPKELEEPKDLKETAAQSQSVETPLELKAASRRVVATVTASSGEVAPSTAPVLESKTTTTQKLPGSTESSPTSSVDARDERSIGPLLAEEKRISEEKRQEPRSFTDPSQQITAYSQRVIQAVFKSYFPDKPQAELPEDSSKQYDLYAYPMRPFPPNVLLQDTIEYLLARGVKAKERRVSYLLATQKGFFSIIVEYRNLNRALAEKLFAAVREKSLAAILADSELTNAFKRLYAGVQCSVIGVVEESRLRAELEIPFMQGCNAAFVIRFLAPAKVNPTIAMTAQALAMLQQGSIEDKPTVESYIVHRKQLVTSILRALEKIKSTNEEQHQKIVNAMVILFKYMALSMTRSRYRIGDERDPTLWSKLMDYDRHMKTDIYSRKTVDLESDLNILDMEPLALMFAVKDNPAQWLTMLEGSCNTQLQQLVAWEATTELKTHSQEPYSRAYFLRQSKALGRFVYSHSFPGIGVELLPWMVKELQIKALIENHITSVKFAGICLLTSGYLLSAGSVSSSGFALSAAIALVSSRLFNQFYSSDWPLKSYLNHGLILGLSYFLGTQLIGASAVLSLTYVAAIGGITALPSRIVEKCYPSHWPHPLKLLGFWFGLLYSYSFGFQSLVRMLIIPAAAHQLNRLVESKSHNPVKASLDFTPPSSSTYIHLLYLACAGMDAYLSGSYWLLLGALGGLSGFVALTSLGKKLLPELRTVPGQAPTQDQVNMLFILGSSGTDLGYSLVNLFLQWYLAPAPRFTHGQALQFFGLQANATFAEIRARRNELALLNHPDKCQTKTEECESTMKDINIAYEVLNPKKINF